MTVQPIDYALVVWFILAGLLIAHVVWDQLHNNSGSKAKKWGVILFALCIGPLVLAFALGVAGPAGWMTLNWNAPDIRGVNMPPGMFVDRDAPDDATGNLAAIHPGLSEASSGRDSRGDKTLEPRLESGVKVFDLETSIIRWSILPEVSDDAYAVNGQVPGPRLRFRQGDRIRINVTNHLPESTRFHWHSAISPNDTDGLAEIMQYVIAPGATHAYEFTAGHPGTYFYHSHDEVGHHRALGLYGTMIIDPADPVNELTADRSTIGTHH